MSLYSVTEETNGLGIRLEITGLEVEEYGMSANSGAWKIVAC